MVSTDVLVPLTGYFSNELLLKELSAVLFEDLDLSNDELMVELIRFFFFFASCFLACGLSSTTLKSGNPYSLMQRESFWRYCRKYSVQGSTVWWNLKLNSGLRFLPGTDSVVNFSSPRKKVYSQKISWQKSYGKSIALVIYTIKSILWPIRSVGSSGIISSGTSDSPSTSTGMTLSSSLPIILEFVPTIEMDAGLSIR